MFKLSKLLAPRIAVIVPFRDCGDSLQFSWTSVTVIQGLSRGSRRSGVVALFPL